MDNATIEKQVKEILHKVRPYLQRDGGDIPLELNPRQAADAKANVDEPLAELKAAIAGDNIEAIKAAVEKVATASQALGAALYANTQAEGGEATAEGDDDVVDAEIVDENEKV
mgnify:CR=1 FL=1